MYSKEHRMKAVEHYIKYGFRQAKVIKELGYPTFNMLPRWYEEYQLTGELHDQKKKYSKYSADQKIAAIEHYYNNGRCVDRTCKTLGYPSRPLLKDWVASENCCHSNISLVKCLHTEQTAIRKCGPRMPKKQNNQSADSLIEQNQELCSEKDKLSKQVELLKQEVYKLQLEKDVLEVAAKVIKKDQGVNLNILTNREKAIVINALREKYLLKDLLKLLHMAKSSYCYQSATLKQDDKYIFLRIRIKEVFEKNFKRYGYRRIHAVVKSAGITVSEKVIRRIMREEHLVVPNVKRKKYNSYLGEISPAVEDIIQRDFHADRPNQKWLTDITEFHIPAGKIYLSPIIDCFDGLPVSWTIGTSPNADLANTMLDNAIATLADKEHPIVHSDRGCHYRWPGWLERIKAAGLTRSMSRKGCSPDNSACEGFFGRLKNEMFYGYLWTGVSIAQFVQILNEYIIWYSDTRIKMSLSGMSPLNYRMSLGLAV